VEGMKPTELIPGQRSGARLLLELDLTRGLAEAPPASPVQAARSRHVPVLRHVVDGLRRAAQDPNVAGLIAHIGSSRQPDVAHAGELRDAVAVFRASGKPTACWAESYGELGPGNVAYHLASAFEQVWLQPSGDVGLVGVVADAVFVRGTLDRLGVQPQLDQRYEYKTAADLFQRYEMSEAHREMASRLVESVMDTIVDDVARARGLSISQVRDAVMHAPLTPQEAAERRLVDHVGYRDEAYAGLRRRLGEVQLRYVERYRKAALRREAPARLVHRDRPRVAVIQASGPIHLGRSGQGLPMAGHSVGSDSLGAVLRAAARDEAVRAVVLRVDSPGGSYVASDAIRREVLQLRETGKPVVASMGAVAASGGYYIAMPADAVVADAGTLTGSIGVLGGKQVVRDALERVGIRRQSVSIGRYAEMFSTQRPFTEEEWQRLEGWLDRVYGDFVRKAAADRHMSVPAVHAVAKGRVWTGADALERRLVDQIGGLDHAIELACRRAGLHRGQVDVAAMPRSTLLERLRPANSSEHPAAAARLGELSLLDGLLQAVGLPPGGVLTAPVLWRLR
jgi:protease IV